MRFPLRQRQSGRGDGVRQVQSPPGRASRATPDNGALGVQGGGATPYPGTRRRKPSAGAPARRSDLSRSGNGSLATCEAFGVGTKEERGHIQARACHEGCDLGARVEALPQPLQAPDLGAHAESAPDASWTIPERPFRPTCHALRAMTGPRRTASGPVGDCPARFRDADNRLCRQRPMTKSPASSVKRRR